MSDAGGSPNLVICQVVLAHFSEDILNEKGLIDQTKTDWVARLGGDWYCRASGKALFEVPKPSIHKGIGVDAIPDFIKNDKSFTGNDLGRLGNIEKLPSCDDIDNFIKEISYLVEKEKNLGDHFMGAEFKTIATLLALAVSLSL